MMIRTVLNTAKTVVFCTLITALAAPSFAATRVFGTNSSTTAGWGGLQTYIGCWLLPEGPIMVDNTGGSQWTTVISQFGTYAAVIEDVQGFGPALRPGIIIDESSARVNVAIPFLHDLVNVGRPSEDEHEEFGQVFVAPGTSITAIAFKDSDGVLITMHKANRMGEQVGRTVKASAYYPHGTLPTVPGETYYLRFVRSDGKPFRMQIADRNPYYEGRAHFDGRHDSGLDLALRIQYDPSGQILRHKPGHSKVYGSAKQSYGQSFTAKGNSLAMVSVFPAFGRDPEYQPSVAIRLGGPTGPRRVLTTSSRIAVFNPGEVPLEAGNTYYLEVSCDSQEEIRMWVSPSQGLEGGRLYIDGSHVDGYDLSMILMEYENDEVTPPMFAWPAWRPGMHMNPYTQRFTADSRAMIVWDVPVSNDINRIRITRRNAQGGEDLITEMPVSAPGRYKYVADGLQNDVGYTYLLRSVDAAGNESQPLQAPITTQSRLPMSPELLNPTLDGMNDFALPYGWAPIMLSGWVPEFRIDGPDDSPNAAASFGWVAHESRGKADLVLYQRVPCEKDRAYRISAEAALWNPWDNVEMVMCATVGIDPLGGDDPLAESVIWSTPTFKRNRQWSPLSLTANAESDYITVYLRGYSQYGRLMDTRFRNVELKDVTYDR